MAASVKQLMVNLTNNGLQVKLWPIAKPLSKNILEVKIGEKTLLLYVKVSNKRNIGFWGITKNRIKELNLSGIKWLIILLYGKTTEGYILESNIIDKYISERVISLSLDGDYKIWEKHLRNSEHWSNAVDKVISRFLKE